MSVYIDDREVSFESGTDHAYDFLRDKSNYYQTKKFLDEAKYSHDGESYFFTPKEGYKYFKI